jgi:hypothetical protein
MKIDMLLRLYILYLKQVYVAKTKYGLLGKVMKEVHDLHGGVSWIASGSALEVKK